jgi:hypothetical protein
MGIGSEAGWKRDGLCSLMLLVLNTNMSRKVLTLEMDYITFLISIFRKMMCG